MFFNKRNTPSSLIELDPLYHKVISKLPVSDKIKYCESLLYRTKEDILKSHCRIQKRRLKKLLRATKVELKKIKSGPP